MPWDRRGDFASKFKEIVNSDEEVKWNKVGKRNLERCKRLVSWFFETDWLQFCCLVVERKIVDRSFHDQDEDLARRKHLQMFLTGRIQKHLETTGKIWNYRVWVDPIASRYARADEVVEIISNRILARRRAGPSKVNVLTKNSKDALQIQLCDLLLGSVMESHQNKASNEAKVEFPGFISNFLGWESLAYDTYPSELKFNIWYFHDPRFGKRKCATKRVRLLV